MSSKFYKISLPLLLTAIIAVESSGRPKAVNKTSGARGLTQFMPATWKEASRRVYGKPLSFDLAFNKEIHLKVARAHLKWIRGYLAKHKSEWVSDEESLICGCWHSGVGNVKKAKFDVEKLGKRGRAYVRKVKAVLKREVKNAKGI